MTHLNLELESFEKYYLNIKSPITIKQYVKYIKQFFTVVQKLPKEITKRDVRNYISDYLSSGRNVTNIIVSLPALKLYFTFLNKEAEEEYLNIGIFDGHDYPSRIFKEQRFTSYGEVQKILKVLNEIDNKFIRVRAKTAILIFATTGARKRETALLQLKDVKINEERILFTKTKNKKPRYVNIPPVTVKAIKKYLELRSECQMAESPYFFISATYSKNASSESFMISLALFIRKYIPDFSFHAIRVAMRPNY